MYWGPLLWGAYHRLAEISDRLDIRPRWVKLMQATIRAMPCERCSIHLYEYLRNHLLFDDRSPATAEQIRSTICTYLLNLHNHVNQTTGKPVFRAEDLTPVYGAKGRHEILLEIQQSIDEIKSLWGSYTHLRGHFQEWSRSIDHILSHIV